MSAFHDFSHKKPTSIKLPSYNGSSCKLTLRQEWYEKLPTRVLLQLTHRKREVSNFEEDVKLADRIFRGMLTERDKYFYTK